jgi:Ca-activated chloride channel family protein
MTVFALTQAPGAADSPVRLPGRGPEVVTVQARPPQRVLLSVSVLDARGEPVTGLTRDAFRVLEDGAERPLLDFAREGDRADRPLSAVMLVDRSTSMSHQLSRWREAVPALLSALRPVDEVRLSAFAGDVTILRDFTADAAALSAPIDTLKVESGGTRLFGAVEDTLRDLRRRAGRKVVFLLTDGLDDTHAGAWNATDDRFIQQILQKAVAEEVTIITILPGPTSRPFLAVQDLAIQTGGWWLYPSDDLPGLVRRLGTRLLESYHLAFDSARPSDDRRRRRIEVRVVSPGAPGSADWQVRTVAGVFGQVPLIDDLEEELGDDDPAIRAAAATALGMVAHPRAAGALRKALKDDSPAVRAAAAAAAGQRGDVSLAGRLSRLLKDGDPSVREAAQHALEAMLARAGSEADRARVLDALEQEEEP